jgi:ribosomal protein S18 acetylase RimI-like enzyme
VTDADNAASFATDATRAGGSEAAREVLLRPATEADVEAIARLWHEGWRDGHEGNVPEALHEHRDLAQFVDRARRALSTTTVAIVDSAIAGFVTLHDDEVEQIYVDRAARGLGAAAALLDHAEAELARHYDVAWLAVVAGNERARRFYAKRGWRDAGPFAYEAAVDGGTFALTAHRYEKCVR